jgi:hypothetical protein
MHILIKHNGNASIKNCKKPFFATLLGSSLTSWVIHSSFEILRNEASVSCSPAYKYRTGVQDTLRQGRLKGVESKGKVHPMTGHEDQEGE